MAEALGSQSADPDSRIARSLADQIAAAAEPLPSPDLDNNEFGAAFDRFGDARVVLLGEATHGTSEFYRARAAITRRLVEQHGFSIVAVEADWPDAARIDAHVRARPMPPADGEPFARFPQWMWRNVETHEFVEWLRRHNQQRAAAEQCEFRGLDIYILGASIEAVLGYLDQADPQEAKRARARYGCLSPWQAEPERYGLAVLVGEKSPCEDAAVAQLRELLDRRYGSIAHEGEALFDAMQNARIVRAAEHYYRIMYRGSTESWNLRDRHMFDTLDRLLDARGDDSKAVVWAHNSHIGDASATAMGWNGEFNIGELARKRFGRQAVAIGFGIDRGTVAAASDWGEPMQVMNVLPARGDSWEAAFRAAAPLRSLTQWRGPERAALREALAQSRLERAIGVVYRPRTELASHYFEAVLAEQFDAYVWFEQTRAVEPLGASRPQSASGTDTWPFGL